MKRGQHLERAVEIPRGELSLCCAEGAGRGADGEQGVNWIGLPLVEHGARATPGADGGGNTGRDLPLL
ncbi:unnamed protein product [Closterium sp. Naga37s-1]|nr:unnamed protein product [Closterium sp. Naga37s-1]